MTDFQWEDPPAATPSRLAGVLAPCMDEPGRWARVRSYKNFQGAKTAVKRLNAGDVPGVMPSCWEFAAREGSNEEGLLYARYTLQEGEAA